MGRTRIRGGLYTFLGVLFAVSPIFLVTSPVTNPAALLQTVGAVVLLATGVGYTLNIDSVVSSSLASGAVTAGLGAALAGLVGLFVL